MERGSASRPTSMYSQTSTESCCSVADSKREMRDLMSSFIADVQRIRETLDDADSAADAAPAVRSGADDDVDMAQPVPGAYEVEPATPAEDYEHKGIWCDSCNQKVFGTRHKCLDCYNFDLCNPCYTTKDIQSTHSDMPHTFEAISPPQPKPKAPARPSATKPPSASQIQCLCSVLPRPSGCHICKPHATKDKRSERPVAYKCDACKQLITGTRHRCMTCPDFDLCEACYTAGSPVFAHSPIHRFMHVEHPIRIITAPAMSANSTSPVCAGACVHEGARYKCENCDSLDLCTNCLGDTEKATVEHAAFHAIQEWDQVVRFVPYTKEPKKQPSASSTVSAPVVHAADCDACNKTVIGTRHKCTVCYDFDLCDSCFNHGAEPMNHKSEHEMIHLDHAQRVRVHAVPVPGNTTPVPAPVSETPRPNTIHHAWCDGCSERIRGVRHKCLDCQDFDFCDACRGREHFNGAHQFYALVEPGEVVVRDAFQPPAPPPAIRARGRANPRSMTTPIPIPPPPPVPAPAPRPRPSHHHPHPVRPTLPSHSAACDMCSSRIRGVRYKCTACPDYDVCESCFRLSEDVHPGHSFAKVYNQGDVVVRKSPQDSFRHHARCDVCQNQIIGIRFKCIHPSCPDFDICGRCEAMPIRVHPDTHALIKLRSHISDYDGLKTVLSFTARGETPQPQSATLQVPVVRIPTPRVQIPSPQMPRSPVGGASVEPSTAMDVFHTAAPSPVVPFSTLGCTIVPHTTIVASLPQSPAPEPMRLSPQVVSSPVIPSPPSTVPSPPPIPAALMSHHSEMYKPSYEVPPMAPRVEEPRPMVTKDEVWAARIREIERKRAKLRELKAQREARLSAQASADSVVHPVTVDEERDPEAPQMTLVNDRPVSTMLERTIVPEPVTMTETAATPEPVAIPERAETPKPELPSLLSAYPYQAAERLPIPPAVSISSQEPSPESSISTLSFDTSILNADFVEDRSIVDGQVVSGGAEFAKCWRMRNSGPVAWPNGTTISFVGGDSMLIQPGMIHWAVTGDLSPGQEIDIEVDMKAPEEPGRYTSYWRLKTSDGEAFGARVWCEVVVAELERAGSSGSSVISASSIIVPPYAPGMSAASVSAGTAPVSPTIHSISSTVHTPSIADTADIESLGSVDSDDSDVWEEVRRQTAAAQAQVAARSEADRFEVVYESD